MLTLNVRLMSFSVVVRMVLPRATPALLMRMVVLPSVERICAAALEMEAGEERSHLKKRTEGGAAVFVSDCSCSCLEYGKMYLRKSTPAHPKQRP